MNARTAVSKPIEIDLEKINSLQSLLTNLNTVLNILTKLDLSNESDQDNLTKILFIFDKTIIKPPVSPKKRVIFFNDFKKQKIEYFTATKIKLEIQLAAAKEIEQVRKKSFHEALKAWKPNPNCATTLASLLRQYELTFFELSNLSQKNLTLAESKADSQYRLTKQIMALKYNYNLHSTILPTLVTNDASAENQFKIVLNSNLLLIAQIKQIFETAVNRIFIDYLFKIDKLVRKFEKQLEFFEAGQVISKILFHITLNQLTTLCSLDRGRDEFEIFKNSSINIAAEIQQLFPELSSCDHKNMVTILTTTRKTLIDLAEEAYRAYAELTQFCHKHPGFDDVRRLQVETITQFFEKFKSTKDYQHNIVNRLNTDHYCKIAIHALNNPGFGIGEDAGAYTNHLAEFISINDAQELCSLATPDVQADTSPAGFLKVCAGGDIKAFKCFMKEDFIRKNSDTLNQTVDPLGRNALFITLEMQHTSLAKILIKRHGINLYPTDSTNLAAYDLASESMKKIIDNQHKLNQRAPAEPQAADIKLPPTPVIQDNDNSEKESEKCFQELKTYFSNSKPSSFLTKMFDSLKKAKASLITTGISISPVSALEIQSIESKIPILLKDEEICLNLAAKILAGKNAKESQELKSLGKQHKKITKAVSQVKLQLESLTSTLAALQSEERNVDRPAINMRQGTRQSVLVSNSLFASNTVATSSSSSISTQRHVRNNAKRR